MLCARRHCHAETGKSLPQTVATKLEAQNGLNVIVFCSIVPSAKHETQPQTIIPPPPKLTVSCYAYGQITLFWHPPNPDSSIRLPDGEARFIIPVNAFPLLQSPMAASFTPLQLMLGILQCNLRLVCGCSAMETHFMKLPMNCSCADVASRGSLELRSQCCNRGQTMFILYVLQHSAVPFCGIESLLLIEVSTLQ